MGAGPLDEEVIMPEELFLVFYITVPVVLLAAAFAFYLYQRREDIEHTNRTQVPPPDDGEQPVT
jgi:hypothetical protein